MARAVRNNGRQGISSMAISAVDCALWDCKARLLGVSVVDLLGAVRDAVPVYGSGGFTSYSDERLRSQLSGWVEEGIRAVKMKVGEHPDCDVRRVQCCPQSHRRCLTLRRREWRLRPQAGGREGPRIRRFRSLLVRGAGERG